jgi:hypothetical protein
MLRKVSLGGCPENMSLNFSSLSEKAVHINLCVPTIGSPVKLYTQIDSFLVLYQSLKGQTHQIMDFMLDSTEQRSVFSAGLLIVLRFVMLWRSCNFTPIHSLTGPVGQPFASHLRSQRFTSQGCTQSYNGTGFPLLELSRYICDRNMIYHSPRPRLHADNGKLHKALR